MWLSCVLKLVSLVLHSSKSRFFFVSYLLQFYIVSVNLLNITIVRILMEIAKCYVNGNRLKDG